MNCPRCNAELKTAKYKGIEIDKCVSCNGMWLDYWDLDQLEDTALNIDEIKGTMVFSSEPSKLPCPKCEGPMRMFRYRAYSLELDFCEGEHGFWLDKGEEKRVLALIAQRIKDLKRSDAAEREWAGFLRKLKSKSFGQKLKKVVRR